MSQFAVTVHAVVRVDLPQNPAAAWARLPAHLQCALNEAVFSITIMTTQNTEKRQKAKQEDESEFSIALSRDDINAMPIDRYHGPVTVARDDADVRRACQTLTRERILGFDTETRPSFKKGVSYQPSLIQLAGAHRVYLFPLPDHTLPAPLKKLLGRADIIKTGVAMDYDLKQLRAMDEFEPNGFIGLEPMAKALRIKNQGLRGLAAALLGFRISKRAQCSNWSRADLTEAQITYAATDAWVSRMLYLELNRRLEEAERKNGQLETVSDA